VKVARETSSRVVAGRAIRRAASARLFAALIALLAACATAEKLEPPKVSIVGLHVVSAEVWVQHLKVRLQLHNPNDRDLPVTALEYTIEIAGQNIASGSYAESFVVPAHGDVEFDTNVTANLASALLRLLTHVPSTLVPYRLAGKITLAEGLGRIPFEEHASFTP
jgi:LEA14-like dessication related protein